MQDKRLSIDEFDIQCIDVFSSTISASFIEWLRSLRLHLCGPKAPHPQNPLQYIPKPLQNGLKTPFSLRLLCYDNRVAPCQLYNLAEDPGTRPQNCAASRKLLSCSNRKVWDVNNIELLLIFSFSDCRCEVESILSMLYLRWLATGLGYPFMILSFLW